MESKRIRGKSGRRWSVRPLLLRGGHRRPEAQNGGYDASLRVDLVQDQDTYGALRRFADRRQRAAAISLISAGAPVTPVLVDLIDDPSLAPSIVTSWAAGGSDVLLDRLSEVDDLAYLMEQGHRWTPAQALRTLVPLGGALDAMARKGFIPIELSPDHVIFNSGSIRLVGISRHLYRPALGAIPDASGMSLLTTLLLGDDHPASGAGTAVWRDAQLRALLRLAGWMVCDLPPALWGPVATWTDLQRYLSFAGFTEVPRIRPGQLALHLAEAADRAEQQAAELQVKNASAVVIYDDEQCANGTETLPPTPRDGHMQRPRVHARIPKGTAPPIRARRRSSVELNAESVRLGLLHQHGPGVIAVAAFGSRRMGVGAALLSGAGWVLVDPAELPQVAARLAATNPTARYVVVGHSSGEVISALGKVKRETVLPNSAAAPPQIAGRSALSLPYVLDPKLDEFRKRLPDKAGSSFRRRTFPAGWAHEWISTEAEEITSASRSVLAKKLKRHAALFADNTELLIRIGTFLRRPGNLSVDPTRLDVNLQQAATVLSSVPARGKFRRDLTSALLGTSYKDLYRIVTQRLLPVSLQLADAYDPGLPLGGRGMDENLFDEQGVRRLGLYGRLVTALPDYEHHALAEIVSTLEDDLVTALADIPAPSLQYLVAKLHSPELLETLRARIAGGDLDLLNLYTPRAWRLLLEDLRQPHLLGALGLGWALVVERDQAGAVDGRVLLRLAGETGREPGHIVRALLNTPTDSWRSVVDNPGLARDWLAHYGDLDIAGVLRVFPNAEAMASRVGHDALRAAAAGGLDERRLDELLTFADGVVVSPAKAIEAFLSTGLDADELDTITGSAAIAWCARRIRAGETLDQTIHRLIADPRVLRTWAVEGRNLSLEILTDVVGSPLKDLGIKAREGRELRRFLEREPGVVDLCARLVFPRQRVQLLRLAAAKPARRLVHPAVAAALPDILDEPDPNVALDQVLDEGLSYQQIVIARTLNLDLPRRELLRLLGPVGLEMETRDLASLLTTAKIEGPAFAVEAAQLECRQVGTLQLLSWWGAAWLPVLAGRQGGRVAVLLARHRPEDSEWTSRWLLAAGEDGLQALARHGQELFNLVRETRPPVADVRVLSDLLDHNPSNAPQFYRLVVNNGLPRETWGQACRWLEEGKASEEVLLRLWDSAAARLLA